MSAPNVLGVYLPAEYSPTMALLFGSKGETRGLRELIDGTPDGVDGFRCFMLLSMSYYPGPAVNGIGFSLLRPIVKVLLFSPKLRTG